MGDRLHILFTPNHSVSRKSDSTGKTTDLHKINHRAGTNWKQKLDELIGHDIESDFSKVVLSVWMGNHALIPSTLFDKSRAKALFEMDRRLDSDQDLLHDSMGLIPYELLFPIPRDLKNLLSERFPNTAVTSGFKHISSEWNLTDSSTKRLFIHLFEEELCLVFFNEQELTFQNHYRYSNAEDILYFILAAGKQYDLDFSETPLYVTGHLEKEGPIISLLRKYIGTVSIPPLPVASNSMNILQANPQQYFHIFSVR